MAKVANGEGPAEGDENKEHVSLGMLLHAQSACATDTLCFHRPLQTPTYFALKVCTEYAVREVVSCVWHNVKGPMEEQHKDC